MGYVLYLATVWLHLIAAAIWLGGMVFLIAVALPAIRGEEAYPRLLLGTVHRFRTVGWIALLVLLATGILQLVLRGYGLEALTKGRLFEGEFGNVLAVKLVLVALTLLVSALHDFYLGPRALAALRGEVDSRKAERLRRLASQFGRLTFVLALSIYAAAVILVRGLP